VGVLPLKVIVPLTDWKDRYEIAPWMVKVELDAQNGLEKTSAADTFKVRSVAQERFVRKLGVIDARLVAQITNGLGLVLEIE
jgi:mRNA interferase MazF